MSGAYDSALQRTVEHQHESLKTVNGEVFFAQSSSPNPGDVLTAIDATHASWQPGGSGGGTFAYTDIGSYSDSTTLTMDDSKTTQTFFGTAGSGNSDDIVVTPDSGGAEGQVLIVLVKLENAATVNLRFVSPFETDGSDGVINVWGTVDDPTLAYVDQLEQFTLNGIRRVRTEWVSNGTKWLLVTALAEQGGFT